MDFLAGTLIAALLTALFFCVCALADRFAQRDSFRQTKDKRKPPRWLGGYRWRIYRRRIGGFVLLLALIFLFIATATPGFLLGGLWGGVGGLVGTLIVLLFVLLFSRSPA
jgi:amino acid transporter